jgi:hypothetical protein
MEMDKDRVMAVLERVAYYKPVPPEILADTAFITWMKDEGLIYQAADTGDWKLAPQHFVSKQRGHRARAAYAHWRLTKQADKLEVERVRRFFARRAIPLWEFVSLAKEGAEYRILSTRGTFVTEDFQTARLITPDGTERSATSIPLAHLP